MEKIIIESAVNTGKKWQEKPIIEIKTRDGRVGSTFDERLLEFIGKEVDLDIKEGKEYNGVKQYYFNLPKATNGSKFPAKDYTFEKKRVALECAVAGGMTSPEDALKIADKYFNWLNTK